MKNVFLGVAVSALLLSSCGTAQKSVNLAGEWNIVSVEGEKVSSDKDAYIGFDMNEGRLYGNAGCNNIMASVSVDSSDKSIKLSEVGATRKMCRDMKLEGRVLTALGKVKGYKATEYGVELTDAVGKILLGLEKKQAAVSKIDDLDGEWLIVKVGGKDVKVIEETPFIVINVSEHNVYGTAGCNNFNGGFSQKKGNANSFVFGELVTTMKSGPGMDQERVILDALNKVSSFAKNSNGTVSLFDKNNNELVVLTKNIGKSLAD